jgi:cell division transport system permease protein
MLAHPTSDRWAARYGLSVLAYCWRCWRHRPVAWLATVVAVAALLALAANAQLGFTLAQESLARQLRSASEIEVFLADGAAQADVERLKAQIAALPGVRHVTYRSKEEALRIAHRDSSIGSLADDAGGNPLPASLVVEMSSPRVAADVGALAARSKVADREVPTSYTSDQARQLESALSVVRLAVLGLSLAALVVAAVVGLVLMRSELRARRAELRILGLVGTPRTVIRLPVLVEAVSIAAAASAIAIASLHYFSSHAIPAVNHALPFLQLGDPAAAITSIARLTLLSSVLVLGGCSLCVRLPR